eukprot:1473427-Alexandrium_andersonii.AAC.1
MDQGCPADLDLWMLSSGQGSCMAVRCCRGLPSLNLPSRLAKESPLSNQVTVEQLLEQRQLETSKQHIVGVSITA